MKLQWQIAEVKDEIIKQFGSGKSSGPEELAISIQKVNKIKRFIGISDKGLENLIDLAFKVSLKKEESRYPSFQLYVPSIGFSPCSSC
jgi:hypothetical protein